MIKPAINFGLLKAPVSLPLDIVAIIGSLYAGLDFEEETF
jgi:hypothetical protein